MSAPPSAADMETLQRLGARLVTRKPTEEGSHDTASVRTSARTSTATIIPRPAHPTRSSVEQPIWVPDDSMPRSDSVSPTTTHLSDNSDSSSGSGGTVSNVMSGGPVRRLAFSPTPTASTPATSVTATSTPATSTPATVADGPSLKGTREQLAEVRAINSTFRKSKDYSRNGSKRTIVARYPGPSQPTVLPHRPITMRTSAPALTPFTELKNTGDSHSRDFVPPHLRRADKTTGVTPAAQPSSAAMAKENVPLASPIVSVASAAPAVPTVAPRVTLTATPATQSASSSSVTSSVVPAAAASSSSVNTPIAPAVTSTAQSASSSAVAATDMEQLKAAIEVLQNDKVDLAIKVERLLAELRRRKTLGTDSPNLPFNIVVTVYQGKRNWGNHKVQVDPTITIKDVIIRTLDQVQKKATLFDEGPPFTINHPRLELEGKQIGHLEKVGEVGMTGDMTVILHSRPKLALS